MLSAFTSGIRNFFLFGNNTDVNSRKRRRNENDEVDGEEFGDCITASTPKKLKTQHWSITGMPSNLQQKMSRIIDNQKNLRAFPVIEESEVPSPGEFQQLNRPPIHYQPSHPTLNGTSDCQSSSSGFSADERPDSGPDLTRERTIPTCPSNVPHKRLYQSRVPVLKSSISAPTAYSSSQRRDQPSFTRFTPKPSAQMVQQGATYTGGRKDSCKSMYEKTFCQRTNGSLTDRLFSLGEKKRLAERDTYRELIRQFSDVGLSSRPPVATSTPYTRHHLTNSRPQPSRQTTSREIPVIVLDDSKIDCTINRTPGPGSRLHPQVTARSDRSKLYNFHKLTNGDDEDSRESVEKSPVIVPKARVISSKPIIKDFMLDDWVQNFRDKYEQSARLRASQIAAEEGRVQFYELEKKAKERERQLKIQQILREAERQPAVFQEEEFIEEEEEEDDEFPVLSTEAEKEIENALVAVPQGEVLVEAYRIQITRKDMNTLAGLNWLNDEIINFYMNMLMERGEKDNPKVYAFSTFFYPKLASSGHSSVRRWTRKIDIFANDYLLVPVHLGMHWCLAVVDFPQKVIQYYDSMRGNNTQCLNALRQYLYEESLDKRKTEFDMTGWKSEIVKNIPEQMNGSDCGMFACKFAEYITRGAPITFTQEHMPYFRRRMVYEILKKQPL